MLLGFNTNCRHRGVLFHVQTEDSGVANPHVITHLFHGGNILSTQKRDYAELLQQADLETAVKGLMEAQHRAVLDGLRQGDYDAVIAERLGMQVFADPAESADTEATLPPFSEPPGVADTAPPAPAPDASPAPPPRAPARPDPAPPPAANARVFGQGVVTEKPLDEVVLDYLVENARRRKRQAR